MSGVVDKIEKIPLPQPLKKIRYKTGKAYYQQKYKSAYEQSRKRLQTVRGKHKGERCFLVATGPSLNKTPLKKIKNEIIFGVNTLYRGLDSFTISPTYYTVGDPIIYNNHQKNILQLSTTLFLAGYAGRRYLEENDGQLSKDLIILNPLPESDTPFSEDIIEGIYYGGTVTLLALQIIFHLGFKETYLVGCDCDYSGQHRFDGSQTENLRGMAVGETAKVFNSYQIYKDIFEKNNRNIYNATVGGKLEVFERKDIEEII